MNWRAIAGADGSIALAVGGVLILWAEVVAKSHASQRWLTYRQAEAAGGNVRRGEKGTVVCYADRFTPKGEDARAQDEDRDARLERHRAS